MGVFDTALTNPPGRSAYRSWVLKLAGRPSSSSMIRAVTVRPRSASCTSKQQSSTVLNVNSGRSSMDGASRTASFR